MKIAEIVSGRAVNGAVMHVAQLAPALARRGHGVTVVCRPGSWIAERLAREPVTLLECDLRRRPDRLRALSRVIVDERFDVMHTHMSSAHAFGALLRLGTGVPLVATAHSCRLQAHWALNDHVICVSEHVARFQRFNLVRTARLSVIHPFVDPGETAADPEARAAVRRGFGATDAMCVIGFVGSVFKEKGVHDLIAALPAVATSRTPIRVVVVGDGPTDYRRQLQHNIERANLGALVHWAGQRLDVARVLHAIDVLAIPTYDDALPIVALEAMAAGTAVVATSVGGVPECVVDGNTGLLVPPGRPDALATALRQLVDDPDTRRRLATSARRRIAERFSAEAQVAKNEAVLDRVARARRQVPVRTLTMPSRGFDPARAAFPTRVVPMCDVIDLLPVSHAPERVLEFRGLMTDGQRFPPIAVIGFGNRFLVADGHKRLTAYVGLDEPNILVEVWTYRRWLRDQWDQTVAHARKNRRMLAVAFSDPRVAWRLLLTTVFHWRRVAESLVRRAAGRL